MEDKNMGAGPDVATSALPGGRTDIESAMATPINLEDTPPQQESEGSEASQSEATQEAPAQDLLPTEEAVAEEGEPTEPPTEPQRQTLGYDQLLPLEQPQEGEDYPEQCYEAYARKFNIKPELLQNEGVRAAAKSKMDSDVLIKNQRFRDQLTQGQEEPTEEPESEQPAAGEPLRFEQMFAKALDYAPQAITREGSKAFADATMTGLQALNEAIESGDETAIAKAQDSYAQTQYAFALLAVQDALAGMRDSRRSEIDQRLVEREGINATYVKARETLTQDPAYSDVAEMFKTGEFKKVLSEYPEISTKQFRGPDGKPLNQLQNAVEQYKFAVRLARGGKTQRPTQAVKQALETGRKQATQAQNRAATGTRLGGRGTGEISGQQEGPKDYVARLEKARLQDNPFAAASFGGS